MDTFQKICNLEKKNIVLYRYFVTGPSLKKCIFSIVSGKDAIIGFKWAQITAALWNKFDEMVQWDTVKEQIMIYIYIYISLFVL